MFDDQFVLYRNVRRMHNRQNMPATDDRTKNRASEREREEERKRERELPPAVIVYVF